MMRSSCATSKFNDGNVHMTTINNVTQITTVQLLKMMDYSLDLPIDYTRNSKDVRVLNHASSERYSMRLINIKFFPRSVVSPLYFVKPWIL